MKSSLQNQNTLNISFSQMHDTPMTFISFRQQSIKDYIFNQQFKDTIFCWHALTIKYQKQPCIYHVVFVWEILRLRVSCEGENVPHSYFACAHVGHSFMCCWQQKTSWFESYVCYFYTFENEHNLSAKLPWNVTVTATSVNMRTQYLTLDCFHFSSHSSFLKGQFEAGPEINAGLE